MEKVKAARMDSSVVPLGLFLVAVGLLLLVDFAIQSYVAYGVVYVILVLATLSHPHASQTLIMAALATVATVFGAFISPGSDSTPDQIMAVNRAIGVGVIWLTAIVIVQRKRAELALRSHQQRAAAILDTMHVAFVGMDAEGRLTDWNPQAELLFGWRRHEIIGRRLAETIIPPELRPIFEKGRQQLLSTGELPDLGRPVEMRGVHRNGRRFPIEVLIGTSSQPDHFYYAFAQDITARKRMERAMRKKNRAAREFASRLISSHEDERRRLARHLHDDLGQELAVWIMNMDLAAKQPPERFSESLRDLRRRAERLAENVREISHNLHPAILEQIGLVAAVRRECERIAQVGKIKVRFESSNLPDRIPAELALPVYRVAQEALRNIAKHSRAMQAEIALYFEANKLRLAVEDNGEGFTPNESKRESHLGLLSMKERARVVGGELVIQSRPGEGTRVEMCVPCNRPAGSPDPLRPN